MPNGDTQADTAATSADAMVREVVAGYQPVFKPQRGRLDGLEIELTPSDSSIAAENGPCWRAAMHVHHWVRYAGGQSRVATLNEAVTRPKCELSVRIMSEVTPTQIKSLLDRLKRIFPNARPLDGQSIRMDVAGGGNSAPVQLSPAHDPVVERARLIYQAIEDVMGHEPPASVNPHASAARRLAQTIIPGGTLDDAQVPWFGDMFLRLAIKDRSIVYADIEMSVKQGRVVVTGATNAPSISIGITDALKAVGRDRVDVRLRSLPDRKRLREKIGGVCRATRALTFSTPKTLAGEQTQLLYGEPVYILDKRSDWLLVHAADGYWGWTQSSAIELLDDARFTQLINAPSATFLSDFDADGVRIPRGASLPIVDVQSSSVRVALVGGEILEAPESSVRIEPDSEKKAAERVGMALEMLATPYVFGGRSPDGLDCSGLVTNVSARTGEFIARDAWQQALFGKLVATTWKRDSIRAGDQVFFINPMGKIYHTGIAISPTLIVHAAPPAVQIGSIIKGDRLYDPRLDRDLFIVKRP